MLQAASHRLKARRTDLLLKIFLISFSFCVCFSCVYAANNLDLEKVSREYFAKHDYDGFFGYVEEALSKKEVLRAEAYYYLALTRQENIDYWKEIKNWEGVYDRAEGFKKEILSYLKEAESAAKDNNGLILKIKYLKWLRQGEDSPDSGALLFKDLVDTAKRASGSSEDLEIIRSIASGISSLEDKNLSRSLYEIYASGLILTNPSQEDLKKNAAIFLTEGNSYLAKTLFKAYLDNLASNKLLKAKETVAVAGFFAHKDSGEGFDPVFAESLYKQAFDDAGMAAYEAPSEYRRAFNLERMKESASAVVEYKKILTNYRDYSDKFGVLFRLGVLSAYALGDIESALGYFSMIKNGSGPESLVISADYHSGLLNQYKNETQKAEEFYNGLLNMAKAGGRDIQKDEVCLLAQERLAEIAEMKNIKYGLKLFLEMALQRSGANPPVSVDVTAYPPKEAAGKEVRFVVTTSNAQTGCMAPAYSYEWSGETGGIANIPNSPELKTDYAAGGIKVVQVVVLGQQGMEGVAFDMVEIQGSDSREQGTVGSEPRTQDPEPRGI